MSRKKQQCVWYTAQRILLPGKRLHVDQINVVERLFIDKVGKRIINISPRLRSLGLVGRTLIDMT